MQHQSWPIIDVDLSDIKLDWVLLGCDFKFTSWAEIERQFDFEALLVVKTAVITCRTVLISILS